MSISELDLSSPLIQVLEKSLMARSLEEMAEQTLPEISLLAGSSAAFLYSADSRLPAPYLGGYGLAGDASNLERLCAEYFSDEVSVRLVSEGTVNWRLYPLRGQETCVGLIGVREQQVAVEALEKFLGLLGQIAEKLIERHSFEKQLSHLNAYLTVSSLLAQPQDLRSALEVALCCCMEAASAEAASVLLLDDEKKNFHFYYNEGPAKMSLDSATFPADQGVAGSVLKTQQSEVINDARNDPRFYREVDSETGFQTRNIIAVPLTAGRERIGVLEVLNKLDEESFTEDEHQLLLSMSEEIAFAIRNAKVFEYVVDSYCKRRQGQPSCKDCERPLGSWTPCVMYREESVRFSGLIFRSGAVKKHLRK